MRWSVLIALSWTFLNSSLWVMIMVKRVMWTMIWICYVVVNRSVSRVDKEETLLNLCITIIVIKLWEYWCILWLCSLFKDISFKRFPRMLNVRNKKEQTRRKKIETTPHFSTSFLNFIGAYHCFHTLWIFFFVYLSRVYATSKMKVARKKNCN